jgi:hypothetical protein
MNPKSHVLRIMQVTFIISVGLFYYVSGTVHPAAHSVNPTVQWAIVLCAAASALMGFIVQPILLRGPGQPLPENQNSARLTRWMSGHILRFATAESVALFGLVLHILGSSSVVVNVLFGSSILLLLFWQPGAIPAQTESQSSIG